MPWKEPNLVDIRYELLSRLRAGERVADLAQEYEVSRKTIYKFQARLELSGIEGLRDQSRRPLRLAKKLPEEVEAAVLAIRSKYPTWGAKKIRQHLSTAHPGIHVPARSTVHQMLLRAGCIKPRKRRARPAHGSSTLTQPQHANHVWATDFKGQFRLGDKSYCYPLTCSDLYSRYLLQCEALSSTKEESAIDCFCELFRQDGLPEVIRSDNGVPFSSRAHWGLSRLSVLWMRLGIHVERIQPGHPEQNGCHERMHRTMKQEVTRPSGRNLLAQQGKHDDFQYVFNNERPHEALDMHLPADVYRPSSRPCPERLPEPEYPLADDVLRVSSDGHLKLLRHHKLFLSSVLAGQHVGITERQDGRWLVSFLSFDLGLYDTSQRAFEPFEQLRDSSTGDSTN